MLTFANSECPDQSARPRSPIEVPAVPCSLRDSNKTDMWWRPWKVRTRPLPQISPCRASSTERIENNIAFNEEEMENIYTEKNCVIQIAYTKKCTMWKGKQTNSGIVATQLSVEKPGQCLPLVRILDNPNSGGGRGNKLSTPSPLKETRCVNPYIVPSEKHKMSTPIKSSECMAVTNRFS